MSKLKESRLAQGLTVAQLAELSKVSARTIQKYESGEINIEKAAVGNMLALAEVLKVEIKDLI